MYPKSPVAITWAAAAGKFNRLEPAELVKPVQFHRTMRTSTWMSGEVCDSVGGSPRSEMTMGNTIVMPSVEKGRWGYLSHLIHHSEAREYLHPPMV
jgi:hypothetical protein